MKKHRLMALALVSLMGTQSVGAEERSTSNQQVEQDETAIEAILRELPPADKLSFRVRYVVGDELEMLQEEIMGYPGMHPREDIYEIRLGKEEEYLPRGNRREDEAALTQVRKLYILENRLEGQLALAMRTPEGRLNFIKQRELDRQWDEALREYLGSNYHEFYPFFHEEPNDWMDESPNYGEGMMDDPVADNPSPTNEWAELGMEPGRHGNQELLDLMVLSALLTKDSPERLAQWEKRVFLHFYMNKNKELPESSKRLALLFEENLLLERNPGLEAIAESTLGRGRFLGVLFNLYRGATTRINARVLDDRVEADREIIERLRSASKEGNFKRKAYARKA